MDRTTIILPPALKLRLKQEAQKKNTSFGGLIRKVLEKYIFTQENPSSFDPFLSSRTTFSDEGAHDVAKNHDQYLYKKSPHGDHRS